MEEISKVFLGGTVLKSGSTKLLSLSNYKTIPKSPSTWQGSHSRRARTQVKGI